MPNHQPRGGPTRRNTQSLSLILVKRCDLKMVKASDYEVQMADSIKQTLTFDTKKAFTEYKTQKNEEAAPPRGNNKLLPTVLLVRSQPDSFLSVDSAAATCGLWGHLSILCLCQRPS